MYVNLYRNMMLNHLYIVYEVEAIKYKKNSHVTLEVNSNRHQMRL